MSRSVRGELDGAFRNWKLFSVCCSVLIYDFAAASEARLMRVFFKHGMVS